MADLTDVIGLAALMDTSAFEKGMGVYNKGLSDMNAKTDKTAGGITGAFMKVGKIAAIGIGAATAAVGALAAGALKVGMEFDSAYDSIISKTGATGDRLEGLKKDANAVFRALPTDIGKASDAVAVLNQRLDLSGEAAQTVAKQLIMMGTGDVAGTTEQLAKAMKAWGIQNENAGETLDKLKLVSQRTGVSVEKMLGTMALAAPTMKGLGMSADQAIAMMGQLDKAGIEPTIMLTGLRQAMLKFSNAGRTDMGPALGEIVTKIKSASTEGEALALGMEMFGSRSGPMMVQAIRTGAMATDDLVAAMQSASGTIQQTYEATADFPEKMQIMKNKVLSAVAPIGGMLMTYIGQAFDYLGPWVDRLAIIIETRLVPGIESFVGKIGAMVNAFQLGMEEQGPIAAFMNVFAEVFGQPLPSTMIDSIWAAKTRIDEVIASIVTGFQGLRARIEAALGADTAGGKVGGIMAAIGISPDIGSRIGSIIDSAIPGIAAAFGRLKDAVLTLFTGEGGFSFAKLFDVQKGVLDLELQLGQAGIRIAAVIGETVLGALRTAFEFIRAKAMEYGPQVGTFLMDAFQSGLEWMNTNLPGLIANLGRTVNAAIAGVAQGEQGAEAGRIAGEVFGTILKAGIGLLAGIVSALGTLLWNVVKGIWQAATSGDKPANVQQILLDFFKGVVDGALTALIGENYNEKFAAWIKDISIKAVEQIEGVVEQWVKAGEEWVNGIITGIENKAGELINRAKALIEAPILAIKRSLGIASPSTVMADIGQDTLRGLIAGMKNMSPAVAEQAQTIGKTLEKTFRGIEKGINAVLGAGGGMATGDMPDITERLTWIKASVVKMVGLMGDIHQVVGYGTLAFAKKWAQSFKHVVGLVDNAVSAIANIAKLTVPADFEQRLNLFVDAMFKFNVIFARVGEKVSAHAKREAEKFAASAGAIVGVVRSGVDALAALGEYTHDENLPQIMADFSVDLLQVVFSLTSISGAIMRQAIKDAEEFSASVQGIIAVIKPGIEAMTALMGWTHAKGVGDQGALFAQDLQDLAYEMQHAVTGVDPVSETAKAFYEAVQGIIGAVRPAIDALTALFEWERAEGVGEKAKTLGQDVYDVAYELQRAVLGVDPISADAKTFYQDVQGVIGIITPAITTLAAMAAYVPTEIEDLPGKASGLAQGVMIVASALEAARGEVKLTIGEEAGKFWGAVQGIVSVVGTAIQTLADLVAYEPKPLVAIDEKATGLAQGIMAVANALESARIGAGGVTLDETATAFWSAIQGVVGVVKPAIDALAALLEYKPAGGDLAALAEQFGRDLVAAMKGLEAGLLVPTFVPFGYNIYQVSDAAITFWQEVQTIVGAVKPAIDMLTELGKYTSVKELDAAIVAFEGDMLKALQSLGRLSEDMSEFEEYALVISRAVGDALLMLDYAFGTPGRMGDLPQRIIAIVDDVLRTPPSSILEAAYVLGTNLAARIEAGLRTYLETHLPGTLASTIGAAAGGRLAANAVTPPSLQTYGSSMTRNSSVTNNLGGMVINASVANDVDIERLGNLLVQKVAVAMRV